MLEVALPEDGPAGPSQLKCFSPPPDSQAEQAQFGATRGWAVELSDAEVSSVLELSRDFRVVPFVDAQPKGGGSPVEVVLSDGQAEARMSWWMSAPAGWAPLERLVASLVEISQRGGSALPVHLDEPGGDEGDEAPPGAPAGKRKGFFGRFLGG